LTAAELAARALKLVPLGTGGGAASLEAAWRDGVAREMDGLELDPDGDGPLWRLTLYTAADCSGSSGGGAASCALVWAANHAVSDQLSFNRVLSQVLERVALLRHRAANETGPASLGAASALLPLPLPLPPSVEGALLGLEQRQGEAVKTRLELLVGAFGAPWGPKVGGRRWLPRWVAGRAGLATAKYALWQTAASGAKVRFAIGAMRTRTI
jgi:hypothetical protein